MSSSNNNLKNFVSIVITTKNEEFHIENCLSSIFTQILTNIDIEVIIVDNFSIDRTEIISKKFPVQFYQIGPERNIQRNFGLLEKAKGDYLVWIDADHIIHPLLIESCTKYLNIHSDVVALMVPEVILGNSFYSKTRRFERQFYEGTVIDGSRFIRSSVFRSIGGFSNEWLHGPDDWDLDLKLLKYGDIHLLKIFGDCGEQFSKLMIERFNINPNKYPISKFHNESSLTLINHLKKKKHYSSNFNQYIKNWGENHPSIKKQLGFYYRFFIVFFENGKWKLILNNPILFCGILFNKFLTGIIFYIYKK